MTRFDYLLGKVLACSLLVSLVTGLPTLLLWLFAVALNADPGYLLDTWYVPFAIVGASATYALWVSGLLLSLSAALSRPVLVAILAIGTVLVLEAVGAVLGEVLHDRRWRAIGPHFALGGTTAPLFGLDLPDWLQTPWPMLVAIALPAALLGFVVWRVRAVEVVT